MRPDEICMEDVRAVEQSILDLVSGICEENGLRYSLTYGTLLGAVRHGGFIPWDDDIDISMPREDYEKLIALWPQVAPKQLVLDRCDLDPENCNVFSKIRKDHTTFLQFASETGQKHHKGIFIDVFPADRVPKGKFRRLLQFVDFSFMLLFNRGYPSGKKGLTGLGERLLLRILPHRAYYPVSQFFARRGRRWNGDPGLQIIFPVTIRTCKRYFPADLYEELSPIDFRGKQYRAYAKAQEFLTICYGDFMQLPPEKERVWKHPPLIVDYSRNYDELPAEEREISRDNAK